VVPVGIVAKHVAIPSGLTEIVQTFEILRGEFVLSELVLILSGKLIVTSVCEIVTGNPASIAGHCVIVTEICVIVTEIMRSVTGKCCMRVRPAVRARCMTTPPMTHVGQATMVATAMPAATSAVKRGKPTATASTPTPAASTSAAPVAAPGDCRSVRDNAKRAHRNTGRQNAYCSLLHDAFPTSKS
jgi:hypothetical protein